YGDLTPGLAVPPVTRMEPPQQGERKVLVEREGNAFYLYTGYRAPEATHPDWFKMALVSSVLVGASAPGGGGAGNRTSRLYRALVETELAASVGGSLSPSINPYLFGITVTARDGRSPDEVQAALDVELDRVRGGDITQVELDKAKKQTKALFAYGIESVTGLAFWLAFSENFLSYTWYERYLERLDAVTLDDVHDAASRYLRPSQRTVGWFIPTNGAIEAAQDLKAEEVQR
ncbi:MAG: insulinase family protein, partial [Chloroflexi bacterium]